MGYDFSMVDFSDEIFDKICDRIACGESVNQICKDPEMISRETFYAAMRPDTEKAKALADKYARAMAVRADYYAEEIIEISDAASKDIGIDADGNPYIDGFAVNRARLMVDSRKWYAGKLNAKKYGDRVQQEHTSPDGTMSPQQALDPEILARKAAFMFRDEMERQKREGKNE